MPDDRTVGKCAALTAAGCIDACALTLSKTLTLRFWLEALNLSWGDYITFEEQFKRDTEHLPAWLNFKGESDRRLKLRMPADFLIWVVFALICMGHHNVQHQLHFFSASLLLFTFLFGLSFFAFETIEKCLGFSPFLRLLQQATSFCYRGEKPPPMLYITDGGCRDCTTLVQLMMRRQTRILMVLAASDPRDELAVLKTAMRMSKDLELATFYNPDDPRRDVDSMFAHFKEDSNMQYIVIGITYPRICTQDGTPAGTMVKDEEFGQLFITKNRLPTEFAERLVEPHLTEDEVRGFAYRGMGPSLDEPLCNMKATDLGPFCCCDFTHYSGCNCGPKFPHGSFSNFMYMTPIWCSSLARLAFDMSKEVVDELQTRRPATWEVSVDISKPRMGVFHRAWYIMKRQV